MTVHVPRTPLSGSPFPLSLPFPWQRGQDIETELCRRGFKAQVSFLGLQVKYAAIVIDLPSHDSKAASTRVPPAFLPSLVTVPCGHFLLFLRRN